MQSGAMILGIVANGDNAATGLDASFAKHFQELPESFSVESSGFTTEQKLAVPQPHGGKVADALARRMVIDDGVSGLRRNPHAAT